MSRGSFLRGSGAGAAVAVAGTALWSVGRLQSGRVNAESLAPSGTLTIMPWDSEAVMGPTLKAFQARYPQVSVDASYVPPVTQYISTLEERLLGGTAPDVFIYTDEDEAALLAHQFVRDLTDQPWVQYMAKANQAFMSANGRVWGLSVTS